MDPGIYQRKPWTDERIRAAYARAMARVWDADKALQRATERADRVSAFLPRLEAVRLMLLLRRAAGMVR